MALFPFLWDFEDATDTMSASDAQRELLKRLRMPEGNPNLADMVDPQGRTYWKLELKQRRRGKRRVARESSQTICEAYYNLLSQGKTKKAALGELAKLDGVRDTTIREIIRRAAGKKKRKRR